MAQKKNHRVQVAMVMLWGQGVGAVARNQDDHTRNIAFLMDERGRWGLSPAFDVVWSYNPAGQWTNRHQMTVHGKNDGFKKADLMAIASEYGIRGTKEIVEEVIATIAKWPKFAKDADVPTELRRTIARSHRLRWG